MHIETDKVNYCPYFSRETLAVGVDLSFEPIFDVCDLCLKNNSVDYCLCGGYKEECEVYDEEE